MAKTKSKKGQFDYNDTVYIRRPRKQKPAAVGTKSDLFLPLFGISRWASKWRFVSTFALTSDSHEVTIFPCYEFSEVSV